MFIYAKNQKIIQLAENLISRNRASILQVNITISATG